MKVYLETDFSKSLCDLAESLKTLRHPAILIGRDLKVVDKNFKAKTVFQGLRKGSYISPFTFPREEERLFNLLPRQTAFVEMKNGEYIYGATAVGFEDCIMLVVRPMWSGLHERLEKIYSRASGYDVNLTSEYTEIEDMWNLFLSHYCSAKEIGFFNIVTAVESIIKEIPSVSETVFKRIKFTNKLKNASTMGSEYDFAVVFAYLLFLCSDFVKDKIRIELVGDKEKLSILFKGVSQKSHKDSNELYVKFSRGSLYWQNLIRLLTDGNLWEIGMHLSGEKKVCLFFNVPLAPEKQPFAVSESYRKYIVCALRSLLSGPGFVEKQ